MSGFLNILLNVMNNRQREKELAANQPFQAAQLKRLELQNAEDQSRLSDLAAIRQAGQQGASPDDPNMGPMSAMRKAAELGRPEVAGNYKQVVDLNETLNEMAARNKTWGGSQQYLQLKSQLDMASQAGDLLNKLHKSGGMPMVKRVVASNPELQKIVGDPETLTFNQEGVFHPVLHAQTKEPVPNWFYYVDQEGKPKMVELKTQQEKGFDQINLGNRVRIVPRDGSESYDIPVGERPSTTKGSSGTSGSSTTGRKRSSAGGQGKAPSGYRWNADGNLEPIPGGPAAMKADANLKAVESGIDAIDASISTIDNLLNHPGREMATGLSSISPTNLVPGTAGYDFNKELESFDAKLFLSNISSMKGMGALSNAEGLKVSAAAGAIKPGMSEKAFEKNLNIIKSNLEKARMRAESGNLLTGGQTSQQSNSSRAGKKTNKTLDATTAQKFLRKAGGNKDKARKMARDEGYEF